LLDVTVTNEKVDKLVTDGALADLAVGLYDVVNGPAFAAEFADEGIGLRLLPVEPLYCALFEFEAADLATVEVGFV
jgi:hypothetical protein